MIRDRLQAWSVRVDGMVWNHDTEELLLDLEVEGIDTSVTIPNNGPRA